MPSDLSGPAPSSSPFGPSEYEMRLRILEDRMKVLESMIRGLRDYRANLQQQLIMFRGTPQP
jgi:hypothetical protein